MSGTVTIAQSSSGRITRDIKAVVFMATDPELENSEITVRGSFSAAPSELPASFSRPFAVPLRGRVATIDEPQGAGAAGEVRDAWLEVFVLLASVMQRGARRSSGRYQIVGETATNDS